MAAVPLDKFQGNCCFNIGVTKMLAIGAGNLYYFHIDGPCAWFDRLPFSNEGLTYR